MRPGLGLTDMCTGLYTHGAIVSALYARQHTGRGQQIHASLFESQIALLTNVALSWLNLGQEAERWGTQHPSIVPYDAFPTRDDGLYFVCGATNDVQFATLCTLLGLESLVHDARFATNADRVTNRESLYPLLNEAFHSRSIDEWIAAFDGSGLPYAPINNMERVFGHAQTDATAMVEEVPFEAATAGSLRLLGTFSLRIFPRICPCQAHQFRTGGQVQRECAVDPHGSSAAGTAYARGSWGNGDFGIGDPVSSGAGCNCVE